jgi:hypothetical protein
MKNAAAAMVIFLASTLVVCAEGNNSKRRVYVTDSQSWEVAGGFGGTSSGFAGAQRGGARPQTAEIMKTLGERCETVIVTTNKERADYVLLIDHEGGKGLARKDTKFALFSKDGDSVKTGSTRSIGNAVKDACAALMLDSQGAAGNATR